MVLQQQLQVSKNNNNNSNINLNIYTGLLHQFYKKNCYQCKSYNLISSLQRKYIYKYIPCNKDNKTIVIKQISLKNKITKAFD